MSAGDAANQLLEILKRRENNGQPLKGTNIATNGLIIQVLSIATSYRTYC